jgi:hypothetical protein
MSWHSIAVFVTCKPAAIGTADKVIATQGTMPCKTEAGITTKNSSMIYHGKPLITDHSLDIGGMAVVLD